jgi:DNA-binding Lrp family transcriptional regulator
VDALDRQIVHCLQRDGRAPFRRIGDVLGVSEQTVARRYRALREGGTLRVLVLPYARAAGGQAWFARILCRPGSVDRLVEGIAARPDVSWVSVTAGGSEVICVTQGTSGTGSGTALLDRLPRAAQVLRFDAFKAMHAYAGSEAEWLAFDDPLTGAQIAALLAGGAGPAPGTDRARLMAEDSPLLAELGKDGRASPKHGTGRGSHPRRRLVQLPRPLRSCPRPANHGNPQVSDTP